MGKKEEKTDKNWYRLLKKKRLNISKHVKVTKRGFILENILFVLDTKRKIFAKPFFFLKQ